MPTKRSSAKDQGREPSLTDAPAAKAVRPKHWPALDGIRGLGVVAIFVYHWTNRYPHGGWLSVDLFFVLSGFLITTLLVGEWDRRGQVAMGSFYARRALRLFPALALNIVACVLLVTIPGPADALRGQTFRALPFVVLYCSNWFRVFLDQGNAGVFTETWSLALEEQFYLLWPTIFVYMIRRTSRRELVGLCVVGLAVVEAIYRGALVAGGAGLTGSTTPPTPTRMVCWSA